MGLEQQEVGSDDSSDDTTVSENAKKVHSQENLRWFTVITNVIMFAEGYNHTQIHPYASWMTESLRGNEELLGTWTSVLLASGQAGLVLSAPFWGALSNRLGRRRCLVFGLAVSLTSTLVQAFATKYWVVVGARFLGGLLNSNLNLMKVMLREMCQQAEVDDTRAFSLLSASYGAANVAGPSLGGFLFGCTASAGALQPWTVPMLCVSSLFLVCWLVVALWLPETLGPQRLIPAGETPTPVSPGRSLLCDASFFLLLSAGFAHSYSFIGWEVAYPLLARLGPESGGEGWNSASIGMTFMLGSIMLVAWSTTVVPWAIRKFSKIAVFTMQWAVILVLLPLFPRLLRSMLDFKLPPRSAQVQLLNYGMQILYSGLMGTNFISIQLLVNGHAADWPDANKQLAMANSYLMVVQSLSRAVASLVTGLLCTVTFEDPESQLWDALVFDHLAFVGCLFSVVPMLWYGRWKSRQAKVPQDKPCQMVPEAVRIGPGASKLQEGSTQPPQLRV